MTFTLDGSEYEEGQPVQMRLAVRNQSVDPCTIESPDGSPDLHAVVYRGSDEVWNSEGCWAYIQPVTTETMGAGESTTQDISWNQQMNDASKSGEECPQSGQAVGPGNYTAVAIFDPIRVRMRRSIDFRIGSSRSPFIPPLP